MIYGTITTLREGLFHVSASCEGTMYALAVFTTRTAAIAWLVANDVPNSNIHDSRF